MQTNRMEGILEVGALLARCGRLPRCLAVLTLALAPAMPTSAQPCSSPADCDDGIACTQDLCLGTPGACANPVDSSVCDNGLWCDGPEWCDAKRCVGGTNAGNPCTRDDHCTGGGTCTGTGTGGCIPCDETGGICTPPSCDPDVCSELLDQCVPCENDTHCTDWNPCNGEETCDPGIHECDDGVPVDCSGFPVDVCQRAQCNPGTGLCEAVQEADGADCDLEGVCAYDSECASGVCVGIPSDGCLILEFGVSPSQEIVNVGDLLEVNLYAVADQCMTSSLCPLDGGHPVVGMEVIFSWDPTVLELADPDVTGVANPEDPCDDVEPCFDCENPNTYNWGSSGFPQDCVQADGLNAPCPGFPANDGDALYANLKQIFDCDPEIEPCATASGMFVTTLKFRAIDTSGPGGTEIAVEECNLNGQQRSSIGSGSVIIAEALREVAPPVSVEVRSACSAPTVEAEGCRYLSVIPDAEADLVALQLLGFDPEVSCVSAYVTNEGKLGSDPVYQSPATWGKVHVRGEDLWPGKTYEVRADCGPVSPGTDVSPPASATLWQWGDVTNEGVTDFTDIVVVVDGFRGVFNNLSFPCTTDVECVGVPASAHEICDTDAGFCVQAFPENVDLIGASYPSPGGCMPDSAIDFTDIAFDVDAFRGLPYPCQVSCP